MRRYLLFATERYALPILRPLEAAIRAAGDEAAWFVPRSLAAHLGADERGFGDVRAVRDWRPDAVLAASNWVPHFFPGVKVQVFHGFNVDKRARARGHFRIRGLFDLYCTQGPATTGPFLALARRHGHFAVVETGWPKLDPLYPIDRGTASAKPARHHRPVVLYAATFTEGLSSATALRDEIGRQIARGDRDWLLTLHPKSDPALVAAYRALAGPYARFVETEQLVPALLEADVLVSDTSSVVSEFAFMGKPVITFRNRAPKPHMLDVAAPEELEGALRRALAPPFDLVAALQAHAEQIHPWNDGQSSRRVLAATENLLSGRLGPLRPKPANYWRKLQMRQRLRYWGRAGDGAGVEVFERALLSLVKRKPVVKQRRALR